MHKVILSIEGMSCSACSSGLEKYLRKQTGIITANVNLVLAQAMIEYSDDLTIDDLNKFIKEAGFKSLGIYNPKTNSKKSNSKLYLIVFSFLSILVMYISMSHMIGLPVIPFLDMSKYPVNYSLTLFILTIPYLVYGFNIIKNGYKNLIHKMPNMDTLVSIGVLASFIYSLFGTIMILSGNSMYVHNLYFESACIIIFFIKLGRYIDAESKEKTREAISSLVTITPDKALLKTGDGIKEVSIDTINVGDILVCKAGMKVAVDGIIVDGFSHFDEAFITGEAVPVKKKVNDRVVAGSLNIDGYIEYKAEKIGKDSTISEIVRLVVEATNTKAPISRIADKVSSVFVPSIIGLAILTLFIYLILGYGINISLTRFVSVLVVACPCALGLATPLAIVVSEGISAKNGILIKNSETLENAHKVKTIVFDKTGTLTYGKLKVSKFYNYSSYSYDKIFTIISSLESKSNHPIATAFKSDKVLPVTDFQNLAGLGLKGCIDNNEYYVGNSKILDDLGLSNDYIADVDKLLNSGNSIIYVVENKKVIALVGVKDIVRDNAKIVIKRLEELDKEVVMLTGDNEKSAKIIAKELGIKKVIANVMPKNKTNVIKKLMHDNMVMMVGDGINDAPSLVTANIGVSVSSGTDIANNSANVILMNNNLIGLVNLMIVSRKTIKVIKQNLFWAFFYNVCMIPLAMGVLTKFNINMNPMVAGFSMTLSSLTVVFNTLRLRRIKLRRD